MSGKSELVERTVIFLDDLLKYKSVFGKEGAALERKLGVKFWDDIAERLSKITSISVKGKELMEMSVEQMVRRGLLKEAGAVETILREINAVLKDELSPANRKVLLKGLNNLFKAKKGAGVELKAIDDIVAGLSVVPRKIGPIETFIKSLRTGHGEELVVFLDTAYFNSLLKSGEDIEKAVLNLRKKLGESSGEKVMLVITDQVYNELVNQLRRNKTWSNVLMTRLNNLIYKHEALDKLPVEISDSARKEMSDILRASSPDKNSRIGEGDMSMISAMREFGSEFDYMIYTTDTDLSKIFAGSRVKVVQ